VECRAEAAALRQVQMKAADANPASALSSVRTKERELNVSEKRLLLEEEAHSMDMRLYPNSYTTL